jgi:hypothetical protein
MHTVKQWNAYHNIYEKTQEFAPLFFIDSLNPQKLTYTFLKRRCISHPDFFHLSESKTQCGTQ